MRSLPIIEAVAVPEDHRCVKKVLSAEDNTRAEELVNTPPPRTVSLTNVRVQFLAQPVRLIRLKDRPKLLARRHATGSTLAP